MIRKLSASSKPACQTMSMLLGEVMLDETTLEQRLAILEHTVADLKCRIDSIPASSNWLERVIGSISDEAAFLEALEYGKLLRYTDRPRDEADKQV